MQAPRILALSALMLCAQAQAQTAMPPSKREVVNAYIYDYASVIFEATRALLTAVPNDTASPSRAPLNQFAYGDALQPPGPGAIIRPNADTIYTSGWLSLRRQPIVLHVPDTTGRYYLIPIYDAYTNEFASIGTRTTGAAAGDYAIIGPNWSGVLPPGLSGVIQAPTDAVWALGRTLVRGASDLPAAVALTRLYTLTPLDHYGTPYRLPSHVAVKPPNPDFAAQPVSSAPGVSKPEFFTYSAQFLYENPPPTSQALLAARYRSEVLPNADLLSPALVQSARAEMTAALVSSAVQVNNWSYNLQTGDYGTNYALRAGIALYGFGANAPADAVYASTSADGNGAALNGSNSYTIHFASGQLPPARGFWSLTLYDPNGFFVPNSINRYDVGSETGLTLNADGSLDILLQPNAPTGSTSNWLPTPAGEAFNLNLRIYWPEQVVLDGKYVIPAVTP